MNYTIAVLGSPYSSTAHVHALKFCTAAIDAGNKITRVFFYHDGVYVALNSRVPPQDEIDITKAWSDLNQSHNVELDVCIANALKRGIINPSEAERYEVTASTLAPGFELVGLGQLIDAMINSDRYIEFPA